MSNGGERKHARPTDAERAALLRAAGGVRWDRTVYDRGALTVPLGHYAEFIAGRLRQAQDVLVEVQFKDSVLGLLALQATLARQSASSRSSRIV